MFLLFIYFFKMPLPALKRPPKIALKYPLPLKRARRLARLLKDAIARKASRFKRRYSGRLPPEFLGAG
jgi:hypothetical protein